MDHENNINSLESKVNNLRQDEEVNSNESTESPPSKENGPINAEVLFPKLIEKTTDDPVSQVGGAEYFINRDYAIATQKITGKSEELFAKESKRKEQASEIDEAIVKELQDNPKGQRLHEISTVMRHINDQAEMIKFGETFGALAYNEEVPEKRRILGLGGGINLDKNSALELIMKRFSGEKSRLDANKNIFSSLEESHPDEYSQIANKFVDAVRKSSENNPQQ